jgi:hypothetical protein
MTKQKSKENHNSKRKASWMMPLPVQYFRHILTMLIKAAGSGIPLTQVWIQWY